MTLDGPEAGRATPPPTRSEAAIAAYQARLRPWRRVYAIAIAVAIVAGVVLVKIAYSHGEISHARLKTAASAAPSVALTGPSSTLTQAWASSDHTAIGTPYWHGTVVTFSTHGVNGRDALTGAVRWSYTRSDRIVCQAAQVQGITVAVFELRGNCDELTALNSGTGARQWNRTLDEDSHAVDGQPSYATAPYTFMVTTPDVIFAIDPISGYDRWLFAQQGCKINGSVLGSAGALISQTCTTPSCAGVKFCGRGPQLLLRDGITGQEDDSSKNHGNPDQIKWNLIGNTSMPVSADSVISAAEHGSTQLTVLDAAKGKTLSTLTLSAPIGGATSALQTARAELIHTGAITYAITADGTGVTWRAPSTALPTVTATDKAATPDLTRAIIAVGSSDGIELLDGRDGSLARTFPVAAPAAGSQVYAFGSGFLVTGSSTIGYR
ncbi:MAG: PQQ-binding-like beta-propeller repeat protein [Jatrophihabitantaceae bacterium]